MSACALRVSGLGKAFRKYRSEWQRVASWCGASVRPSAEHWVLRHVSFSVAPGEAVGIVGQNGAGKSTLLKLITGTQRATEGHIEINGRVAAILELGIGFNPEFTGRQNVYHAAGLMGFGRETIEHAMPEIEAFAEIGEYFDEPLRTYSSGMQMRVAFAVATAFRPDILIVDEALSVGDIAFQAKCIQRMTSFIENGVAVLFVSHALTQIRQFCTKAVLLSNGRMVEYGDAVKVCDTYQNSLVDRGQAWVTKDSATSVNPVEALSFQEDPTLRTNSILENTGSMELAFTGFEILNQNLAPISACSGHDKVIFKASIRANTSVEAGAVVGLFIGDKNGLQLLSCNSDWYKKYLPAMQKGETAVISWEVRLPFVSGEFRVDIGLKPEPLSTKFYDRVFCAKTLQVHVPETLLRRDVRGLLYADADISIVKK